jgi:hypothetical protein
MNAGLRKIIAYQFDRHGSDAVAVEFVQSSATRYGVTGPPAVSD